MGRVRIRSSIELVHKGEMAEKEKEKE